MANQLSTRITVEGNSIAISSLVVTGADAGELVNLTVHATEASEGTVFQGVMRAGGKVSELPVEFQDIEFSIDKFPAGDAVSVQLLAFIGTGKYEDDIVIFDDQQTLNVNVQEPLNVITDAQDSSVEVRDYRNTKSLQELLVAGHGDNKPAFFKIATATDLDAFVLPANATWYVGVSLALRSAIDKVDAENQLIKITKMSVGVTYQQGALVDGTTSGYPPMYLFKDTENQPGQNNGGRVGEVGSLVAYYDGNPGEAYYNDNIQMVNRFEYNDNGDIYMPHTLLHGSLINSGVSYVSSGSDSFVFSMSGGFKTRGYNKNPISGVNSNFMGMAFASTFLLDTTSNNLDSRLVKYEIDFGENGIYMRPGQRLSFTNIDNAIIINAKTGITSTAIVEVEGYATNMVDVPI